MTTRKHKITNAYIGGGSQNWAVKLFTDLAHCPQLPGSIKLYDTDNSLSKVNARRAAGIFGHKDSRAKFKVEAVKKPEDALSGAGFVVMSILPGPITMMARAAEICERPNTFPADQFNNVDATAGYAPMGEELWEQ